MRNVRAALALSVTSAALLFAAVPAAAQSGGSTPPASVDPTAAVPIGSLGGVSSLSPNCGSGNGCVYTQIDFNGSKTTFGVGDAGKIIDLGSFDRSAANRFNARYMAFYRGNGSFLSCINDGKNDRNLFAATDILVIGGSGSNC